MMRPSPHNRHTNSFWSTLKSVQVPNGYGVGTLLISALVFSVIVNLLLLTPSIYMLQVYDRVLTSRSLETLLMISLITVTTLVVVAVLEYARSGIMAVIADSFERYFQASVWERSLERSTHPDQTVAGVNAANQSLRDLSTIRAFLSSPALYALFDAPWVLVYAGVIYLMHPILGMVALVSAFLLLLLAALSDRSLRRSMLAASDGMVKQQKFYDSVHRSADLVVGLRMMRGLAGHATHLSAPLRENQVQTQLGSAWFTALTKFVRQNVQIIMLGLAAYVSIVHDATPGVMIAATVLLGRALAPAEQAIGAWRQFVETRLSWDRIGKMLQVEHQEAAPMQLPKPKGILRFENMSFAPRFGATALLKGIHFETKPGELIAVVGASGSGKSTLARLMVGLWQPTVGKVTLDGVELSAWDREQLSQYMGYMPQQAELIDGTVAQNIARFSQYEDSQVLEAANLAHAHELICSLENAYDTTVGSAASYTLSGGQRQRVALARAVYGQPSMVVLDEPNASLDSEGEQALFQCLKALKQRGITVIVVTQKVNLLQVADRIMVMNQGKIEKFATRAELEAQRKAVAAPSPTLPTSAALPASQDAS
jgi:PrtD family type I secretion system ABC transporter